MFPTRYELGDLEWAAIKPMLPNTPRGAGIGHHCRADNPGIGLGLGIDIDHNNRIRRNVAH